MSNMTPFTKRARHRLPDTKPSLIVVFFIFAFKIVVVVVVVFIWFLLERKGNQAIASYAQRTKM